MKRLASIIIPVYNQVESLLAVLKSLAYQDIDKHYFEIVIVDDGSTDRLRTMEGGTLTLIYDIPIKLIHRENGGRAKARNDGINNSSADILIFCDADRIPESSFISKHIEKQNSNIDVVIGASLDFWGNNKYIETLDWRKIDSLSREGTYLKKVSKYYQHDKSGIEKNRWLTLLIGNSSIKKSCIDDVGGFNNVFKEWGFEHFELGYRLEKRGYIFGYDDFIKNYHLPHKREEKFYEKAIGKNISILQQLYPKENFCRVKEILLGTKEI